MPPPKKVDLPHKLVFTTNSLRNTTISVDNDALYYEVVTRFWHPYVTKIRKLNGDTMEMVTIAELERIPGKTPRLRWMSEVENAVELSRERRGETSRSVEGQEGWINANEWLQKQQGKIGGVFSGDAGIKYRWKTHRRRLQLVHADTDDKTPVAVQHKHKRHFWVFRMSKHAWLEIKPDIVETMDALIMSYLLVERQRRDARVRVSVQMK